MTTLIEVVTARVLEFAQTMQRLHVTGVWPGMPVTVWPVYEYDQFDRNAQGEEARQKIAQERNAVRITPSAIQIQRSDEVQDWLLRAPMNNEHRICLQAWARCKVSNRKFSEWCRETGRHRRSSVAVATRAIDLICAHLRVEGEFPTLPEAKTPFPNRQKSGTFPAIIEHERAHELPALDLPEIPEFGTPEYNDYFLDHLQTHNKEMRRQRRIKAERERQAAIARAA